MLTELPFQLAGKIYRSPMPFGPYSEHNRTWSAYREMAIDLVVILVEKQEYLVHAGVDLPAFYREQGLDVVHVPVPDFQVPGDREQWNQAVEYVRHHLEGGENAVVHCMAGIGRTGMFTACLARKIMGCSGQEAIDWVRRFIPGALENRQQEEFVINFDG